MTLWTWVQAALALALVLALAWGAARALRGSRFVAPAGRRLQLAESLALDTRRRLLLLRCDGRELLLLTGGGQDIVLGWLEEKR
jgi:flagellar protein FliO/FliZ